MSRHPHYTEEDYTAMLARHAAGTPRQASKVGSGHEQGVNLKKVVASPYRSKWEAAYASKLEQEKLAGVVLWWYYEPFSLWLPGKVRYKPDFLVQYQGSLKLYVVEVKGYSRNLRDGMTRLKIAAAMFPCFQWVLARRNKGGWEQDTL